VLHLLGPQLALAQVRQQIHHLRLAHGHVAGPQRVLPHLLKHHLRLQLILVHLQRLLRTPQARLLRDLRQELLLAQGLLQDQERPVLRLHALAQDLLVQAELLRPLAQDPSVQRDQERHQALPLSHHLAQEV
jgi:hypothetical protein